ncbi:MAG: UbiX family flavin prenyltransferase [Bacteroidota bacterium]
MYNKKIVVAVTGASGAIYAKVLLDSLALLVENPKHVALIFSKVAKEVWQYELGNCDYEKYPFSQFEYSDFYAPTASGSSNYEAMIVCPCTMGTMGRIASGVADDLITRSADVMLKERRKLILVARETPFSLIHIENMRLITLAGGIILPANPSFYSKPKTIEEVVKTVTDRVLKIAGFDFPQYHWGEEE